MEQLYLVMDFKDQKCLDAAKAKAQALPYQNVLIKPQSCFVNNHYLSQFLDIIRDNSEKVVKVEFFCSSSIVIKKILDAIGCEKITTLIIYQGIRESITPKQFLVLPNLKVLETHQASVMLQMFRGHKIETLRIFHDWDCDYERATGRIRSFISSCPNLKELLFDRHFPEFSVELMPFKFKLKSLTVSNDKGTAYDLNSQQFQTLKKLLEVNMNTLESVFIGQYSGMDGILEYLLPRAKCLKSLTIMSPTFAAVDDFLCKNTTVKELSLSLSQQCDKDLKKTQKIISNFAAVEDLNLTFGDCIEGGRLVQEASRSFPNLKKLSLDTVRGSEFNRLHELGQLEELFIKAITHQSDITALVNLLTSSPNIRKLTIQEWNGDPLAYMTKIRLKRILHSCPKLEEIFIGRYFLLPKTFVDGLLETDSAVRRVKIETNDVNRIKRNARRLLHTNIQFTVTEWTPKKTLEDDDEGDEFDWFDEFFYGHEAEDSVSDILEDLNDADELMEIESSDSEPESEVDDRFDEFGRRRSKRLKLANGNH